MEDQKIASKKCTKCGIEKSRNSHSWCQPCLTLAKTLYWKINRKKLNAKNKIRYWANTKKACDASRRWREANPEKNRESIKRWNKANPERLHILKRRSYKKERSTVKGKLNHCISSSIRLSLHGSKKGCHWEDLVGYTIEQLKRHIEKRFTEGMSWEKYIKGEIHIDHIIPISAFNFAEPEDLDFKRCWNLKNLQPLWAKENLSKRNKVNKPFQPSLLL